MSKGTKKPIVKTVHCVVCDQRVGSVPFQGQEPPRVSTVCPVCIKLGYRVLLGTLPDSASWAFEIVPPGRASVLADAGDPLL
jgi:hypothetical protein